MANYDLSYGNAGYPSYVEGLLAIENTVDFSKASGTLAATDTINLLEIPDGAIVMAVYAKVVTACSAAMTMTVGDASDADGWIPSISLNGTAGTPILGTGAYANPTATSANASDLATAITLVNEIKTKTAATGAGKVYTSTTTLIGTLGGTCANNGKLKIKAIVAR